MPLPSASIDEEPERGWGRRHGYHEFRRSGRAAENASPAWHAPTYYHDEVGWNARLDGFQGAILSVKLKYIEGWNQARRAVAMNYHACSALQVWRKPDRIRFMHRPAARGSRQHACLASVCDSQQSPRGIAEFLTPEDWFGDLLPCSAAHAGSIAFAGLLRRRFPEAERAAREVLALPIFPELREDEQETVVAAVAEFSTQRVSEFASQRARGG